MRRDTLRDRQNMEILDVFKNIHSQVADRQMKQVAVFPESVLPKTQRDLAVEVNVDKGIDSLNSILESKLGSLEYFVQNINVENRGAPKGELSERAVLLPYSQAYQQVIGTGELVPVWNLIVRAYQSPGLSKQSQEIIKVKMQELKGNLDAMKYGLSSGIQAIFEFKIVDAQIALKILELLRALSVYTLISMQADSGVFEQITMERLSSSYKNVIQSLSLEQIEVLRNFSKVGRVFDSPIRNIPLFGTEHGKERLKEVSNELGFDVPPELLTKLVGLPASDFDLAVAKIKNDAKSAKESTGYTREETKELEELSKYTGFLIENENELERLESEKARLTEQLDRLNDDPEPVDPDLREPEEMKEPIMPVIDLMDPQLGRQLEYYAARMEVYRSDLEEYNRYQDLKLEYILARQNALSDRMARTAARKRCERELARVNQQAEQVRELIFADEMLKSSVEQSLSKLRGQFSEKAVRAMKVILDASGKVLKLHKKTREKFITEPAEQEEEEEGPEVMEMMDDDQKHELEGDGGSYLRGRGLSGMGSNYGTRTRPSRHRDTMQFDDTRNDTFYSKPK